MLSKLDKCPFQLLMVWVLSLTTFLTVNVGADDLSLEERERAAKERGISLEQFYAWEKQMEELGREVNLAVRSTAYANQLQATLRDAIAKVDSGSVPVTVSGNNLPISFSNLFPPGAVDDGHGLEATMKSGFMGLGADKYSDQLTVIWAGGLINTAPEILMPLLQERAKVFPPTATDYILYAGIIMAFNDNEYELSDPTGRNTLSDGSPPVALSRSDGFLNLAQAQNPIYRLLAAKSVEIVEPDTTKRLTFVSSYVNETDPYILRAAIKVAATTHTTATQSVLQSLQPAVQRTGDAKLAANLQEQIQRKLKQ